MLKIRLEIARDQPPGFDTEVRFLLSPIPFSVRAVRSLRRQDARREVAPFVTRPEALSLWSRDFFLHVVSRIIIV